MLFKVLFINLLTSIRIIGSILLIPIYHYYGPLYVGIVSFLCYVTDVLDGALARHFNASTFFGALFDGIADKLLTIVNFIVLYLITPYAIIPIIFEIGTVLLQLIKYNKHFNIKSNNIGKLKVWVLALTVVVTFVVSDISKLTILNDNTIEYLSHISYSK